MYLQRPLFALALALPYTLAQYGYGGGDYGSAPASSSAAPAVAAAAVTSSPSSAASSSSASSPIKVAVGSSGLKFTPDSVTAPVGSSIEFTFYPKNHTVTQSSFKDPCHPLADGFSSSFVPTKDSPSSTTFTITVKDTKPIWIYCAQATGNHCQQGMVMAVNAPATGNTLEAYVALAKNATKSSITAGGAVGGVLAMGSDSASGSSGSSGSSSASGHASVMTYTSMSKTYTTTMAPAQTSATTAGSGTTSGTATGTATGASSSATGNAAAVVGAKGNAVVAMVVAAVGFAAVL